MENRFIACIEKRLPANLLVAAAATAVKQNPTNHPILGGLLKLLGGLLLNKLGVSDPSKASDVIPVLTPEDLALLTTKYWGAKGVTLTVGFPFDSTPSDLQSRILLHMNAWGDFANVKFALTNTDPQVRITRAGDGYWSYLGTDILHIPANEPTMTLQDFTMSTPESEFHRVVRHETGHTLGFAHEHMRKEIVSRLDPTKTMIYFMQTQGWSPTEIQQQVLTPLDESTLKGTAHADQDSIMAYQLPGSITTDGQPIRGGLDIDDMDKAFAATLYPLAVAPIVVPNPPPVVNPPTPAVTGKIRVTVLANADGSFAAVESIAPVADS